ncbi:MAG: hypothetical protein J5983_04705 [Ruminococcus sp.]|nr:hypothetical protein [Ruminococcus sp.]
MISKNTAEKLYTELANYERKGVCILMNGSYASPMQVVKAHMVREDGTYMRDYEMNATGNLEKLDFVDIKMSERKN